MPKELYRNAAGRRAAQEAGMSLDHILRRLPVGKTSASDSQYQGTMPAHQFGKCLLISVVGEPGQKIGIGGPSRPAPSGHIGTFKSAVESGLVNCGIAQLRRSVLIQGIRDGTKPRRADSSWGSEKSDGQRLDRRRATKKSIQD